MKSFVLCVFMVCVTLPILPGNAEGAEPTGEARKRSDAARAKIKELGGRADEGVATLDVDLRGTRVTDADLTLIGDIIAGGFFTGEYSLNLDNTQITDDGLAEIAVLRPMDSFNRHKLELTSLSLNNTAVTDTGLEHLKNPELLFVHLNNTEITDVGLKHLAEANRLVWLHVDNTEITDDALKHLRNCRSLSILSLRNTQITDAGLEHLSKLPALKKLYIRNTKITVAGLAKLPGRVSANMVSVHEGHD